MEPARRIKIPDLVKDWPFPRKMHPAVEQVKRANDEWTKTLGINSPELESALARGRIALLSALCYPDVPVATLQWATDIMTVFLVFDEITDKLSGAQVDALAATVEDVFEYVLLVLVLVLMLVLVLVLVLTPRRRATAGRGPHREIVPEVESTSSQLSLPSRTPTRQHHSFWTRARARATPTFLEHFPERCLAYVRSVAQQAHERDARCERDIQAYLHQRRQNAGVMPSFAILLHSLDIPAHVLRRRSGGVRDLEVLAGDMIILANDICSYNVEQSRGDAHNAVAVLMRDAALPVQDAIEAVARMYGEAATAFLREMDRAGAWDGAQTADVRAYVLGLANWVRGNFEMSFEVERYRLGPEARRGEWIALLPGKGLGRAGEANAG
ncbi:unnamed protein product [Diplocarpon coronariae]